MMKIGIDFGTFYTKIVYPDEKNNPLLFHYPNKQAGNPYISSEISYILRQERCSRFVGANAFEHINDPSNVEFHRDFRMGLPLASTEWPQIGWENGRTPVSVTQDYFEELLTIGRYSFTQQMRMNIDQAIISVPEAWYRDMANPGPDRLLGIFENLGLSRQNILLQSEPVCAAAFYAHCELQHFKRKKLEPYNLLVCDMGGGTFDVALCKIEGDYIRVLHHDGSRENGMGLAGAAFDRACVEAACLTAFKRIPDHSSDFYRLLRAFEATKINPADDSHQMISETTAQDLNLRETKIYSFDDSFSVTVAQAWQAFLPIRDEIRKVLKRIGEKCSQKSWKIDRAIVVGGFGQYHLVQQAIFDSLPENVAKGSASDEFENERYYAIARGALCILTGMVQVSEPIRDTLGIITHGSEDGFEHTIKMPIIHANQAHAGMITPQFATHKSGERIIVKVAGQCDESLPIYAQRNGVGDIRMVNTSGLKDWPQPGEYTVGFQIDRSNRAVIIFEHRSQNQQYVYPVGELDWE